MASTCPSISEDKIAGLRASLSDKAQVLTSGTAAYDESRAIFNRFFDRKPALIVRPAGVADVVTAVKFAKQAQLPLSVKGGGHNASGKCLVHNGLTIDLSLLNGVRVNAEKKTARVEGGALWRDLDFELAPYNLGTPGGVVHTTGIGGLVLGGGWGFLTRQYGLASDNLLAADVVTADGRVLHCSENQNSDLFWAIRGGSGNFGVVVSFKFRLYDVGPKIFAGPLLFNADKLDAFLAAYRKVIKTLPERGVLFFGFTWTPPSIPDKVPAILALVFWQGPKEEAMTHFQPLWDVGPLVDMAREQTYFEAQSFMANLFPPRRYHWKSGFIQAGVGELPDEAVHIALEHVKRSPSPHSSVVFEDYFGERFANTKTDQLAFPWRAHQYCSLVIGSWDSPENDPKNEKWTAETYEALKKFYRGAYANFQSHDPQAVWGPNYPRLKEIKEKYDPENLFRNNNNAVK